MPMFTASLAPTSPSTTGMPGILSPSDYFVIDSETIGADDGTWRFRLVDQTSSALIVDVALPAMA